MASPAPPSPAPRRRLLPWLLVAAAWAAHSALLVLLVEVARQSPESSLSWSVPVNAAVSAFWALATPGIRWLVPRLAPARVGGVGRSAAAHAAAALAAAVGAITVRWAGLEMLSPSVVPYLGIFGRWVDYYAATYVAVAAIVAARDSHRAYVERARHALVLEAQLTRARLDFLQRQLQPHFLFNALNAVAELADEAPALAARMLRQLSRLLRAATEHLAVAEVPLRDELLVLDAYVEVQRARFGEALAVRRALDPRALDALVPTFVLQPLVENAIRHGLERRRGGGRVAIAAAVDGDRLRLRVEDGGHRPSRGDGDGDEDDAPARPALGSGIGLSNTRQRLAQLHGAAQRLELRRGADGGMVVEVELPLRRGAAAPAPDAPDAPVPNAEGGAPASGDGAPVVVPLHAPGGEPVGLTGPAVASPAAPAGDTLPPRGAWRGRLRAGAAIVAAWAGFGVLWTAQLALLGTTQRTPIPPDRYAYQWVGAAVWVALTPLVLLLAARLPIVGARGGGARSRVSVAAAAHLAACVAVAAAQVAVTDRLMGYRGPLLSPGTVTPLTLNVVIYLAVVAWVNARHLARSRRERAVAADRLAADVERVRLQALALEVSPAFVGAVLDRTAEVVTRDAERAEEVIEGLADLLRAMLDAAPGGAGANAGQAPTARHELALVQSCAELLALAFGRRVRVRSALPAELREARVPAGGLRPVLAAAAARLAERPGADVEIRVTATAAAAEGPDAPVGELRAWVVAAAPSRAETRSRGAVPRPATPGSRP